MDNQYNPQMQQAAAPTQMPVAQPKLRLADIEPGSTVLIQGKMGWNRISSFIQGRELENKIARDRQNNPNAFVKDKPHTSVRLYDAQVLYKTPGAPTPIEMLADQRMFQAKNPAALPGNNFSIESSSKFLPSIGLLQPDGSYDQVYLEQDLDNGVDVIIQLRVFKPKNGTNNGWSLDYVLINEPTIRYRQRNSSRLADFGIVFNSKPNPNEDHSATIAAAQSATQPLSSYAQQAPAYDQQPAYQQPAPQATYSNVPQQGYQQQPVQQAAPAPAPAQQQPSAVPVQTPYPGPANVGVRFDVPDQL